MTEKYQGSGPLPPSHAPIPEYEQHAPHYPGHHRPPRPPKKPHPGWRRTHIGLVFFRIAEILAIVLSILQSSRIARFLSTKAAMDIVVEVTDIFGKTAGHHLSTFFAFLVAEPQIITVIVTAVVLIIELTMLIVRSLRPRRRPHRDYP